MLTEDKVTELFCIADDFCKFFDTLMEKYTLKSDKKRHDHRDSTMSKAEIAQVEHSRQCSFENFIVNLLTAPAAYCFFPPKPSIAVERSIDRQLSLF